MDFGLAASGYRTGTGAPEDDEVRCSGVPRANTTSLSGHGSAKLGEQELHLQISHRRTETTVRSGAEWHEGQVRRAATMSLSSNRIGLSGVVSLSGFGRSGFGEETDTGSGQQLGKRGFEIEVPIGWKLRFIGEGVNQPLRRVGDLPQRGRQ
jgi:hypothetical protein